MGFDYTDGCVNYRDVGEFINLIASEKSFNEGVLLRGGSIDYVKTLDEIGHAKTVINLRNSSDPQIFDSEYFDFPMSNKIEKYDTSQKEVKVWLNQIVKAFENANLEYPILIHCLSGKDRTGIVISALLSIIGVEKKTIIEEYLLSEGDVKKEWINLALDGMKDIEKYFDKIQLELVRENLNTKFTRMK